MLPSKKTETSSADFQPGMEASERMAPLWKPARERRSTPIVQGLPSDTHKGCGKGREFPEELQ